MKQNETAFASLLACASIIVSATILTACSGSNDMMQGDGTTETKSGYAQSHTGLDRIREGSTTFKAGKTAPGLDLIRRGAIQFSDGLTMMRSGLGMMSGHMTGTCGGSPDQVMEGMEKGMATVRGGLEMMEDADPKNDVDGLEMVDSGMKMGEDGMKVMDGATSCMGHGKGI